MIELVPLSFKANYKIETIDRAVKAPTYEFFDAPSKIVVLSIKVTKADGSEWIAEFHDGICGIEYEFYATPSPDVLCAVIQGIGYWIDTNNPDNYQIVKSCPILKVFSVPERKLIIFVDPRDLCAYDSNGFLWKTTDLSWDGIEILNVTAKGIQVRVWVPVEDKTASVTWNGCVFYED